tara:strand:+ start:941 stop:1207 length:267 start_codon:yes stop_codon:yes gene_type:complete
MKHLKMRTITKLLGIIDTMAMLHFDMMKTSKLHEHIQVYLDKYTNELHEVIKADVGELVEDWELQNSIGEYIEELEKKLEELDTLKNN